MAWVVRRDCAAYCEMVREVMYSPVMDPWMEWEWIGMGSWVKMR